MGPLLLLCLAAEVYAFTPTSAYYAGSLNTPERKAVLSIAAGRPGAVPPVSWKGTRRVGTVPGMRPTMNQQQLPSKTYTSNQNFAEVTLRFLQREVYKAKSQVRLNLQAAAIDTTTIFSHQHKVAAPVEPVPDSRLLTLNGLGSYSLPSVGVLEKSKSDGTSDEYTQMNAQFAEDHEISLPLDAAGKPAMPGFYLFEDYQQLFQNVDDEYEEDDLDIQGSLPSGLYQCFAVRWLPRRYYHTHVLISIRKPRTQRRVLCQRTWYFKAGRWAHSPFRRPWCVCVYVCVFSCVCARMRACVQACVRMGTGANISGGEYDPNLTKSHGRVDPAL